MFIGAADCHVQLHGWGLGGDDISEWLLLVSVNGVVYVSATAWEGISAQGFFTYTVDPSSCTADDAQYWNTFSDFGESTRLINYLRSLGDGNRIIIIVEPLLVVSNFEGIMRSVFFQCPL